MNAQLQFQSRIKSTAKPSFQPARRGQLQRECACGGTPDRTGECDKCRRKRLSLGIAPATVPPIVHEVLLSSGQPLDTATRNLLEPRFGHQFSQVKVDKDHRIHSTLTVSQPNDELEREAEQTADRVCNSSQPPLSSMLPSEQPLSGQRRGFDFSHVRVHSDTKAAAAVHAVNAEAFAVNHHIVFGAGRYAPGTSEGQRLLAHELAHVVQRPKRIPDLRRKLRVDPNHPTAAPPSDPAASLTNAQRFSMMDSLIQGLCDQFEVDSSTGEVQSKSQQSLDRSVLAGGAKPTGCCCLAILSDPAANTWTIEVSQVIGPQTLLGSHQVILNPTTTPVEFGSFTASGTLAFQGAVPAAGHELCGHAALDEIGAHPAQQDRTTTDVHDPTVRIENLISSEQGVPPSELRGLAASGPHRGESVDRVTIQNYPFNVTEFPASEQSKIEFAAAYIIANSEFVDVLGHSDSVGSNTAKQFISDQRASKVRAALIAAGVPPTISKPPLTNVPRFTRVEGLSDTHPPPPPLDTIQANWRRVDILMAGFPAGAQKPPTGTPTTVTPHIQNPNVPSLKASGDPCVRLLAGGAYP
jgi:outer membrane protein OmpA-like peptidoglycan-associated protein